MKQLELKEIQTESLANGVEKKVTIPAHTGMALVQCRTAAEVKVALGQGLTATNAWTIKAAPAKPLKLPFLANRAHDLYLLAGADVVVEILIYA